MELDYRGRSVTVTGGGGYLGASLIAALTSLPRAPRRIVRISRRALEPLSGVTDVTSDVRDPVTWSTPTADADVIFHLAATTSVAVAEQNPEESLNNTVLPLMHLAAAASAASRAPHVVLASTSTVHGLPTELPVTEATEIQPVTVYDLHKRFAEEVLFFAMRRGLLTGTALRLGNVYGPSPLPSSAPDRGVLNRVAGAAWAGDPIYTYGGGAYLRDYVFIEDVVRAFLLAGIQPAVNGRAYVIGSGNACTLRAAFELIADRVGSATGRMVAVHDRPWPPESPAIDRRNYVTDSTAFQRDTGWAPSVTLAEGIDRLIATFRRDSRTA